MTKELKGPKTEFVNDHDDNIHSGDDDDNIHIGDDDDNSMDVNEQRKERSWGMRL